MSRTYTLTVASDPKKKFTVVSDTGKSISFGARGYEDYTMHHNKARQDNYLARHSSNENWNDTDSKGFWSRWLLWNLPTIEASIRYIEDHFGIRIIDHRR